MGRKRISIVLVVGLLLGVTQLAAAPEENAKVAGKWKMTWEGRMGMMTATLTFEQPRGLGGANLKGILVGEMGRETPLSGLVKGNSIKFSVKREAPRGEMTIEYAGTVEGDIIKGTMQMGPISREWTAKREKQEKQ